jgi:hypothetical protein
MIANPNPSIDEAMRVIPKTWQQRWCTCDTCACMGCANIAGGLQRLGFSKQDHADWMSRNAGTN